MNETTPTAVVVQPQASHWKTTVTSTLAALSSALTILAMIPAGNPSDPTVAAIFAMIPEQYKPRVVLAGLIATLALRVLNGIVQADKTPLAPALPPVPTNPTADQNIK